MPDSLPPVPIPMLAPPAEGISPEGALTRNFARRDLPYMRRCEGHTLDLHIGVNVPAVAMSLRTDLPAVAGDPAGWRDIPFVKLSDTHFQLKLPLHRPGGYQFCVRYTVDGNYWMWDRVGYSRLLVDPAWQRDLRVYSLVPTVSGTVKDWCALLPGIAAMGFNVVHLLPITQMDYSESPYCALDLFSLDPHFVDPEDPRDGISQFEDFVALARKLGIRLCVDLVLNHVGPNSVLAVQRPDWIHRDSHESDGFRRAGWSDGRLFHKWRDLALINYDNPDPESQAELWRYMGDYALFWGRFAAQTGGMVRLDNLHSGHEGAMINILDRLRAAYPSIGILAELFTDLASMHRLVWTYRLGMMLATPWEHRFLPQLRSYLEFVHSQSESIHFYFPITSHDSGSPAEEFGHAASTKPRYALVALCGGGLTGSVQGVEYGVEHKLEFIGRHPRQHFDTGIDYRDFFTRVNRVMQAYSHFHQAGNLEFVDNGHEAVLAAIRTDPDSPQMRFLVLCNFDTGRSHGIRIEGHQLDPERHTLQATEELSGKPMHPLEDGLNVLLAPCEVQVIRLEVLY